MLVCCVFSGIAMAVSAGLVFGLNFTPVIYIQQHPSKYPTASSNGNLSRLTSHYCLTIITRDSVAIARISHGRRC